MLVLFTVLLVTLMSAWAVSALRVAPAEAAPAGRAAVTLKCWVVEDITPRSAGLVLGLPAPAAATFRWSDWGMADDAPAFAFAAAGMAAASALDFAASGLVADAAIDLTRPLAPPQPIIVPVEVAAMADRCWDAWQAAGRASGEEPGVRPDRFAGIAPLGQAELRPVTLH